MPVLRSKRAVLLVVGVLFHLLYLWSIFDIYFVSPLVHGMRQHPSTPSPPAKRLFLMVGDGQKAETTFSQVVHPITGEHEFLAPYLRSVILNKGTYGVAHTRMPTESRPGHVAMIAGFYEDVSAVTKGWKENPVDFDSFFNQSAHTYSFGSPDILPMFAKGASSADKVDTWMYGAEFEDFTHSSIELDKYVFDHLDSLFENSTRDEVLDAQIRQDKNVFFLHLLGTDTAGHSYRPYSAEYYDNIKYTDHEIEGLVQKVNAFFGDEDTAFIFTADHGMSDFGSHGDGHPNNTRTPFICWGAGCNGPVKIDSSENAFLNDAYESAQMQNWHLDNVVRHDIKQADITSLMSYLIGTNYPANSVGELPVSYIAGPEKQKIQALYVNALSILEQYKVKLAEVASRQLGFKPYPGFEQKSVEEYQTEIESLIEHLDTLNDENRAVHAIELFISQILQGLDYLQKYNWVVMKTIVTLGFLGWIVYSYIIFLEIYVLSAPPSGGSANLHLTSGLVYSVIVGVFAYEQAPLNNYLYAAFPVFFWDQIISKRGSLVDGTAAFFKGLGKGQITAIFVAIFVFFEAIAYGFGNRIIFSAMFLLLGLYPIALDKRHRIPTGKLAYWLLLCTLLSYFPSQNPIKTENLALIIASGVLMLATGVYVLRSITLSAHTRNVVLLQLGFVLSSIVFTSIAVVSLQKKQGLPKVAQIMNWINIVGSVLLPYILHHFHPDHSYKVRYLIIYLTFAPTFETLTISFEALFYVLFALMLYEWLDIESRLTGNSKWLQLLRVSVIGFFDLQIAFFGTGNVSSISSFSLESVYRLVPVFDPFAMGALLMFKLIIPYVLLSVTLGLMNVRLRLKKFSISTLLISVSVILSLNFFFMVRTEGSWLDIGLTISNYCLAILSSLFMLILEVVSHVVLSGVEMDAEPTEPASPRTVSSLKINDESYKQIEAIIEKDTKDKGSIASRVRRRKDV